MKKILIILNHTPTEAQIEELKTKFNINEFLYLPENIKSFILNVPPENEIPKEILIEIANFIETNLSKGDYVWVQTEYGITFFVVDFAIKKGFTPIYSTTKRIYTERKLNDKKVERKYIFEHVNFRYYIDSEFSTLK